jgi:hypothetical protein
VSGPVPVPCGLVSLTGPVYGFVFLLGSVPGPVPSLFVCLFVKRLDRRYKPSASTGVPCGILPTLNEIFFILLLPEQQVANG